MGITSGPLYDLMTTWMMAIDGPSLPRRLVSRAFRRAVEAMRPDVQALADGLCDELAAQGGDVVAGYAFPLPMEVVRLLFAIDADVGGERDCVVRSRDRASRRRAARAHGDAGRVVRRRGGRAAPGSTDMFSA
jgi:cytochrome P450